MKNRSKQATPKLELPAMTARRAFLAHFNKIQWVRAVATLDAGYGVGYVADKLSIVQVHADGVVAEPATLGEAASVMQDLHKIEIALLLDGKGTDDGFARWCGDIIKLEKGAL